MSQAGNDATPSRTRTARVVEVKPRPENVSDRIDDEQTSALPEINNPSRSQASSTLLDIDQTHIAYPLLPQMKL